MMTPRAKRCVAGSRGSVGEHLPEAGGIDRQQRQDRAELDQHLEGAARAFEAEQPAGEQQVGGR